MNIVQLTPAYFPHIGGVETHVLEVNKLLQKRGHSLTVVTVQHDKSLPLEETIDGVKVIRLPTEKIHQKIPTWKWVWQNQHIFEQADIIQVHDIFWWLYPILPMIEDRVFTTFHGWEGNYPVKTSAKFQRLLANIFSRGSVHVGDWIREFYWDTPDVVTYGGAAKPKTSKKTGTNKHNFVFFGRLSRDNDIEKYIELVTVLKKQLKGFSITWVGDGEYADECKKLGKVTGFVADPEKYVSKAHFVWASSYLSLLAALAHGRIACAFYSHVLKERYLETFPGYKAMIVSDSPKIMAEQIHQLLTNSERQKQLSQQASLVAGEQPWSKVADMYERLWEKTA